jgi:hypothetical protein
VATQGEGNGQTPSQVNLEQAKLDLEKRKIEEDIRIKREELEIKRRDSTKSVWSSPLLVAVIGLFATIMANIIQNYLQSEGNRNLERQRFESTLIQKALETGSSEEAAKRLQFLVNIGFIKDETGKIANYVSDPETIPLHPVGNVPAGDNFEGNTRKAAKLSIGNGAIEDFNDLKDLIASLPPDIQMISHNPPILMDANSERANEEQRNVRLRAFLYAANKDSDNDFRLILGRDPNASSEMYMITAVSGLPPSISDSFSKLKAARDGYKQFFADNLPGTTYDFYSPPIPVEVEGSLFFNISNAKGQKPGPQSLKSHIPTMWEIRPITKIVFTQ